MHSLENQSAIGENHKETPQAKPTMLSKIRSIGGPLRHGMLALLAAITTNIATPDDAFAKAHHGHASQNAPAKKAKKLKGKPNKPAHKISKAKPAKKQKSLAPPSPYQGNNNKTAGVPKSDKKINAPAKSTTFLKIDSAKLAEWEQQYTPEAVAYALRIVENGVRIAASPDKEAGVLQARAQVEAKFSGRIKIPKYFGYADDAREVRQITAIKYYIDRMMAARGKDWGIVLPPELVVGAMGNEGSLLDIRGTEDTWESVDGFWTLGLDWFAADFPEIVAMGILPKSFEGYFKGYKGTNEIGVAHPAHFRNKGAAIWAFISELIYRQKMFMIHLQKQNISLDTLAAKDREDILCFFTYIYYNAGQTAGRTILAGFKTAEDVLAYYRRTKTNPGSIDLTSAPANSYVVNAGAMWLKTTGAFDQDASKKGFWWAKNTPPAPSAQKVGMK